MCKNIANERKEKFFSNCRVQLCFMQKHCKRAQGKVLFKLPSAAMFYAKTLQTSARKSSFQIAEYSYVLCKGKKKKPFLYLR